MKFTCERCGKKYATAENPTPGRVYKLKCKACGHVIMVKATAAHAADAAPARPDVPAAPPAVPPSSAAAQAFDASAHSAATPIADLAPAGSDATAPPSSQDTASISLEIGAPEPAHVPENGAPRVPSFEMPTDLAAEALRDQHALEHTPTRGDSGYVDLFSDVSGIQELPQRPSEDPFMSAARASLPDGYGTGSSSAPDPFADLREDISATSEPQPPPRSPPPVPKMPVIPRPKQERSNVPLLLIGAGVAVMVGILAFVLLSSGKKGAPEPAPVAATARAPAAPPVAAPTPPPPVQPQVAQPELPLATPAPPAPERSDDAARVRADQKRRDREEAQAREEKARAEREAREREAKAQARTEREAKERAAAERDAKAKADREARAKADREARERAAAEREARAKADREAKAQARADREAKERAAAEARERERAARQAAAAEEEPAEEGGLTQPQIEGVLRSTKPAFDGCIRAARGGEVALDGRRVMLRLNIQSTGTVTYPTLDDVTLNSTDVGTCLKNAARVMVFPKFRGDTMHVEVPLVMR